MSPRFDACLEQGIGLFNRRQYFEAHEIWEDAWRESTGEPAMFLQGLIQVAAAFVKLQRGQPRGMLALLDAGAGKLRPIPNRRYRVDHEALLAALPPWRQAAERMLAGGSPDYDDDRLPCLAFE
jgi:uncharacterized protein